MEELKRDVVVLLGAGQIGMAIIIRVGYGKHVVIADVNLDYANEAAKTLYNAGFEVSSIQTDLGSRESIQELVKHACSFGNVTGLVCGAGVSPSQAPIELVLKVDLYGTSVLMEEFGKVIAKGGSAIIISSQSGHRLGALSQEENEKFALTPTEELLDLDMLKSIQNTLEAYQYSKRCNVLRVAAESVKWGKRGARINSISPGIIITPLANDELNGPRGENYRKMIDGCPAKRAGTPDEVGDLACYLMSEKAGFITGADFLIDGGTTASYWYGDLSFMRNTMGK